MCHELFFRRDLLQYTGQFLDFPAKKSVYRLNKTTQKLCDEIGLYTKEKYQLIYAVYEKYLESGSSVPRLLHPSSIKHLDFYKKLCDQAVKEIYWKKAQEVAKRAFSELKQNKSVTFKYDQLKNKDSEFKWPYNLLDALYIRSRNNELRLSQSVSYICGIDRQDSNKTKIESLTLSLLKPSSGCA